MGYTYNGEAAPAARRKWSRPKQRIRQEVYMEVRDPKLIKELRLEKGFNQRQLATLTKCSQAAISAIETGKLTSISEDLGAQIAHWLDRRPRELFDKFDDSKVEARIVTIGARTRRQRGTVAA